MLLVILISEVHAVKSDEERDISPGADILPRVYSRQWC